MVDPASMVGGWFSREDRKRRIEELEGTVSSLQENLAQREKEAARIRENLDREQERRREAVTARQSAQEQVNRLEQRIAQLVGEVKRLRGHELDQERSAGDPGGSFCRREDLHGRKLEGVLDRLGSFRAAPQGAWSGTVRDVVPEEAVRLLGDRVALVEEAAPCLLYADDAGILAFALRPPLLPDLEPRWGDQFVLEPEWFQPSGRFALVLARSDLLAAGIYEGGEQIAFKGLKPRVGRRHSRGGFSQGRFERIREEQIADHIKRCKEAMDEFLGDEEKVVLVGQRETVDALARDLDPVVTRTVDATGAPRQALEDAFSSFWTTRAWWF